MITSTNNAQVKQVMLLNKKSRERKKQDVFLVISPIDKLVHKVVKYTYNHSYGSKEKKQYEVYNV